MLRRSTYVIVFMVVILYFTFNLGMMSYGADGMVQLIVTLHEEKSPYLKTYSTRELGNMKDVKEVEPLIVALADEGSRNSSKAAGKKQKNKKQDDEYLKEVRQLVDIFCNRKDRFSALSAVKPLIVALKDENHIIRGEAERALACLQDLCAFEPLLDALKDDNSDVRSKAVSEFRSLRQGLRNKNIYINDSRAVDPLIFLLKKEGGDPGRQEMIRDPAVALEEIGAPAVKPLITLLREETLRFNEQNKKYFNKRGDIGTLGALSSPSSAF